MKKLFLFIAAALVSTGMWAAASTTTDGKYATGTVDFSEIGTLTATTTYWHNGVKFYSGNAGNISANTSAWSEQITIPAYISDKTASNQANKGKWGSNGSGKQYTMSGFACSQHTIGIHVNQACTLTVVVNKNLQSDTDDAGITASLDATAYGTAWDNSSYKAAGTALTVTSARADKTNAPGRYTLTIVVTNGNLTDGEAVVKMFNGSSGTGSGKLFCWESITVTAACAAETPATITKGTLSEGNLQLLSGTPAAKNAWYWQDTEDGTSTSNAYSTETPRTVSAAGTYYLRSYYDNSCWGDAQSITLTATDFVANYTVVYKDGSEEIDRETVAVGSHPEGIANPTKELYTFAGWEYNDEAVNPTTFSGAKDQTYNFMATWNPNYLNNGTNAIIDFEEGGSDLVDAVADYNILASVPGEYDAGKEEENWAYKGWKIKSAGATVKFVVPAHKYIQFKFGYLKVAGTINISDDATPKSVTGASNTQGGTPKYTLYTYQKTYEAIYTFTTGDKNAAVIKSIQMSDEEPTALDKTQEEAAAVKRIVNGQLFIEKNGHVYNVLGGCVK